MTSAPALLHGERVRASCGTALGPFRAVRRGAIIPAKSEVFRDILVKRLTLMLMTGKEYLQSIRDGRVIYVGKERVKDQTTHPAFADGARTYAALFDMKSDPAVRDLMTFEEDGECYSMYYLQPRSQEDLRRRNRAHRKIADFCFGLMGRTPDAFAGNLTGLSLKPEVFDSAPGGAATICWLFTSMSGETTCSRPMRSSRRRARATRITTWPRGCHNPRCGSRRRTTRASRSTA